MHACLHGCLPACVCVRPLQRPPLPPRPLQQPPPLRLSPSPLPHRLLIRLCGCHLCGRCRLRCRPRLRFRCRRRSRSRLLLRCSRRRLSCSRLCSSLLRCRVLRSRLLCSHRLNRRLSRRSLNRRLFPLRLVRRLELRCCLGCSRLTWRRRRITCRRLTCCHRLASIRLFCSARGLALRAAQLLLLPAQLIRLPPRTVPSRASCMDMYTLLCSAALMARPLRYSWQRFYLPC